MKCLGVELPPFCLLPCEKESQVARRWFLVKIGRNTWRNHHSVISREPC